MLSKLWAFRQAFEDGIEVPCDATVIGERVQVLKFDFDGNERRELTAVCRRPDGTKHEVAAAEVVISLSEQSGRYVAAYRNWMGIAPFPSGARPTASRKPPVVATAVEGPIELVVLSVKQKAARCRVLGGDQNFTFRARQLWDLVPGEIAVVRPAKQWTYAGAPYLSGAIESTRLDANALGLVPLRLEQQGVWNPAEHYWGEKGEALEAWTKPIIARGPRLEFEMEQVLPGADAEKFFDPIGESNDRKDSGDEEGAYRILMDLCQDDLRCLDAHAHLGSMAFTGLPKDAIRHYEAGFRIGELSLGGAFDGLLPWGWIDNRPFLRCIHGYGLCLWRLGKFKDALQIFERMLWLNPSDNQGVRFLIHPVRAKEAWRDGL